MTVSTSELKNDIDKYLYLSVSEDVYITENGRIIAKLTAPFREREDMASSLFGVLPADITLDEAREEYLKRMYEDGEDEYDIAVAEEAYAEYIEDGRKSRLISALWKEMDV